MTRDFYKTMESLRAIVAAGVGVPEVPLSERTGTGPQGNFPYDVLYFAPDPVAAEIVTQFGGKVLKTPMAMAFGGPYKFPSCNSVQFENGTIANAGLIYLYATWNDPARILAYVDGPNEG